MANFVITGKAEQTDESSYTIQSTGEVVTKIQLTLNVPGMQDRVLCEMPLDASPKPDILEQWEMEETWLVVSANTMRALGFTRSNARPESGVTLPRYIGSLYLPAEVVCQMRASVSTAQEEAQAMSRRQQEVTHALQRWNKPLHNRAVCDARGRQAFAVLPQIAVFLARYPLMSQRY